MRCFCRVLSIAGSLSQAAFKLKFKVPQKIRARLNSCLKRKVCGSRKRVSKRSKNFNKM